MRTGFGPEGGYTLTAAECAAMLGVPLNVFEREVAPAIPRPYTTLRLARYVRIAAGIEREPIAPAVRAEVYRRDGWRCLHCGTSDNLSIDHIKPWSLGGPNSVANFQTLCRSCNSRKGARWIHA